jgi:hypothetical protein
MSNQQLEAQMADTDPVVRAFLITLSGGESSVLLHVQKVCD